MVSKGTAGKTVKLIANYVRFEVDEELNKLRELSSAEAAGARVLALPSSRPQRQSR